MSEEKTLIEPRKHSFTLEYMSLQTAVEHLTHTQLGELTAMILAQYGDIETEPKKRYNIYFKSVNR